MPVPATGGELPGYTLLMGGFRPARAVPALLIAAALLAGCSSGAGSAPTTPTTAGTSPSASSTAAVCVAAADLKTAIGGLASINVASGGLSSVQQALDNVKTKLDAFQAAARSDFGPQATQLRTALSNLQTALATATTSPNVSTMASVATSVGDVISSYNSLKIAVATRCG
jgi:ABC-type glycerol-3-phosphate transport system substrate-binding protein